MTLPLPPEQQAAVIAAYQQQTAATRTQLTALVVALWRSLPDYRNQSLARFVQQVVPVVQGAMGHMQATTSAYLATLFGATPTAVGTFGIGDVRNGADPTDVYGRPFHLVWRMLGEGTPFPDTVTAGEARAVQTAVTDLQLAKTHTSRATLRNSRHVTGYRRVLEGPHSCGLCVVASTARYHKQDLMPMHPACDCSVAPIVGDSDPGHVINEKLLADAHQAVADRFGADSSAAGRIRGAVKDNGQPVLYRDVLITHDHSELGPILAVRGAKHTTVEASRG